MSERKHKRWALVGVTVAAISVIGAYQFIYAYLVRMTEFDNGTSMGTMKNPDILDSIIFLFIIAIGLIGIVVMLLNLIKILKKEKTDRNWNGRKET